MADIAVEKFSVAQLKEYLASVNAPSTGPDKATLLMRARAYIDGCGMLVDGVNPALMKVAQLRKVNAARSLPCGAADETFDEMLDALMKHLRSKHPAASSSGTSKGASQSDISIALARQIIALGEEEKWLDILSILGRRITFHSSAADMRKEYLRLSLILHPDKLRNFPDATKSFQCLVTAFERASAPPSVGDAKPSKNKTISRSNEGCFRTPIKCPRCKQAWGGDTVQGLPPYTYNYLMTALQTYCCCTCLCRFGCMTAIHGCPHCGHAFDYHPDLFHTKVQCKRSSCGKTFGFFLFPVSDRVEKEMRESIRAEVMSSAKALESKMARAARQQKSNTASIEDTIALQEALFVQGLVDACPRCGCVMRCASNDQDSHTDHLLQCKDSVAIASHQKKLQVEKARSDESAARLQLQADLQSKAAWSFLGANSSETYLLTDGQLDQQLRDTKSKIRPGATRQEKIAAVSSVSAAASGSSSALIVSNKSKLSRQSLPENLFRYKCSHDVFGHIGPSMCNSYLGSCSLSQLNSICAANGITPKAVTVTGLAREIESLCDRSEGICTDPKDVKGQSSKVKKRKKRESDDDCSSDSDYEPDE